MNLRKAFLVALIGLLIFVSWLMVKPFLGYLMTSVLLAFTLHPAQRRLEKRFPASISASILVIGSLFLLILPLILSGIAVFQDAQDLAKDVDRSQLLDTDRLEQQILELTGRSVDIRAAVDKLVGTFFDTAFGNFAEIVSQVSTAVIGITLMLFVAYYLLKDGGEFVDWLTDVSPLPQDVEDGLVDKTRETTWAVLKGHVMVAFVQGVVAGIGLLVTGVPNYLFWTFMMMLLGFLPIVGSAAVWLPASLYLVLIGRPGAGIFLFIYGALVVGLVDNIVRPLAVDRGTDLHPAIIIIGVVGGVYAFGAAGLFIGPIILGAFRAILEVFKNNYESL